MCDEKEQTETSLPEDVAQFWTATHAILERLPNARKAVDRLTGGLLGDGMKALASRLHRYRTGNLVQEAQQVAEASGMPLPAVFDTLVRQRRIDELSMDALRLISTTSSQSTDDSPEVGNENTSDRWYQTFYNEAGMADEGILREAFLRMLAGEIRTPGSFSLRALRTVGSMSQSTARNFRRAASFSIRESADGTYIHDARIPAIGGDLGQNCLQEDGLSYHVLQELMEHGLIHTDLASYYPYGRMISHASRPTAVLQLPAIHQNEKWILVPTKAETKASGVQVLGAAFTSCGRELFRIVDVEPSKRFRDKLVAHLSQLGLRVSRLSPHP